MSELTMFLWMDFKKAKNFFFFFCHLKQSVTKNHVDCIILIQDAHHREAMGLLHTAERSSLISEIHQLRGQLEQLHQSKSALKHFVLSLYCLYLSVNMFVCF